MEKHGLIRMTRGDAFAGIFPIVYATARLLDCYDGTFLVLVMPH